MTEVEPHKPHLKSILPTSNRRAVRAKRLRGARRVAMSIGTWPYLAAGACSNSSGIQCADATSVSCSSGTGACGETCKKTVLTHRVQLRTGAAEANWGRKRRTERRQDHQQPFTKAGGDLAIVELANSVCSVRRLGREYAKPEESVSWTHEIQSFSARSRPTSVVRRLNLSVRGPRRPARNQDYAPSHVSRSAVNSADSSSGSVRPPGNATCPLQALLRRETDFRSAPWSPLVRTEGIGSYSVVLVARLMYRISMVVLGLLTHGCAKNSSSCSRTVGCRDADAVDVAVGSAAAAPVKGSAPPANAPARFGDAGGEGLSGIE